MANPEQAPAVTSDQGKEKDWRERVNPLLSDILDQHFPFVKGSLRFELVDEDKKEESR